MLDVRYQDSAHASIQRALSSDRVPHAYIFHGPDGVGKEMLAVGLAKRLLCARHVEVDPAQAGLLDVDLEKLQTACDQCDECTLVSADSHPDLNIVYRQLNRSHPALEVRATTARDISVGVLRHFLIDRVGLTPKRGRCKVFVIREADRMKREAQNTLLKTLEEPPGNTVIILLVDAIDRLLPTVLSRCQLVSFGSLPLEFVREKIEEQTKGLTDQHIAWYAGSCNNSIGQALAAIEDDWFALNDDLAAQLASAAGGAPAVKWWEETAKTLGTRYKKRDNALTDSEATRRGLKTILGLAANWYADVVRAACGNADEVINAELIKLILPSARNGAMPAIEAIERIREAEQQLDANAYTKLIIESLLNELPDPGAKTRATSA